jgi:hypothetical protein
MPIAGLRWWIVAQTGILAGIALNTLTLQEHRLSIALALLGFALTFVSHNFRGRARAGR